MRALQRDGADPGRSDIVVNALESFIRVRDGSDPGQCAAKLWEILHPGGMRVRRSARFGIRIALWMLTELESAQRGCRKNDGIVVTYGLSERFLRYAYRSHPTTIPERAVSSFPGKVAHGFSRPDWPPVGQTGTGSRTPRT